MFAPLLVEVKSLGEDVLLAVGSWNQRLHFETAVLLAAWMDECARDAKLWARDTKHLLRGIGTMHDASNPHWLDVGQPFTPNGVPRVDRTLLQQHEIDVRQEGALVTFVAGTTMMQLPYQAALQISQWLRLKAKESQTRAGDSARHWSELTKAHVAQHGPGVTRG